MQRSHKTTSSSHSYKKLINNQISWNKLSVGELIDILIRANLHNWSGKEYLFKKNVSIKTANEHGVRSFQANKLRNNAITTINHLIDNGPAFHFRNYHNY